MANTENTYRVVISRIAFAVLMAAAANALSADTERSERRVLQEQYGGVVANETVTVAGQDFYKYFVEFWRDQEGSERYAISVHERPSARWGNQIWVEYAQRRVFQAVLPSSRASINAVSEQAAGVAYQSVVDAELQRLLFRDADVGPDEL